MAGVCQLAQPAALVVWGKNDSFFLASGAQRYKRDLKDVEFHLLDTGHFALEEDCAYIVKTIRNFLTERDIWKLIAWTLSRHITTFRF